MVRIFIDFDGTITLRDVGDAMFEAFGGDRCREIIGDYRSGAISAVECFRRESAACGEVEIHSLERFLDTCEIDSTFPEFIQFCRDRGMECGIVSDGMDFYIGRILARHGCSGVPFHANHLELLPVAGGVRFQPSFPFTDEVCDRCACCKRNHMLTLSAEDDRIVYIGEGYSDRCPARFADILFAKDDLLQYCRRENISCFEYGTFADIQSRLNALLGTSGRLPKRHQAELARRAAFSGG